MSVKEEDYLKKIFYFFRPLWGDQPKWKGFRDYLKSPLLGNGPKKVKLLDELGSVMKYPRGEAIKMLFKALSLGNDTNDRTVRNLLSKRLNALLELYYGYEAFLRYKDDDIMQWRYLMQEANHGKWDDYFLWLYKKKAGKALDSLPRNENYYLHKMDLSDQFDAFMSRQEKDHTSLEDRYREELSALNEYFALYQLKLACNISNQRLLLASKDGEDLPLIHELVTFLEANAVDLDPLIRMYLLIYQGLTQIAEDHHFPVLKELLFRSGMNYGREEARTLCAHATNYCSHRYNRYKSLGNEEKTRSFQNELIELYNFQLEAGIIFLESGGIKHLDHGDFKNIVVQFSSMGEFEWVEAFIERYGQVILKDIREVAGNFALGILNFFKGDYREAELYIRKTRQDLTESQERYYALSLKFYYLRILYERRKLETCERETWNIAKAVGRSKYLPKPRKESYQQFCTYLRKLCQCQTLPGIEGRKALEKLRKKIENGPPCILIDWLLEKIGE